MAAFRFRKKTDYGLLMISILAKSRGYVSVSYMQEMGLPRSFLVKIARDLIRAKIIGAKEGRGGGYFLACDPETTTLKNVVEALEGRVSPTLCVHGEHCPFEDKCSQRGIMHDLARDIETVLDKYKISDFAR